MNIKIVKYSIFFTTLSIVLFFYFFKNNKSPTIYLLATTTLSNSGLLNILETEFTKKTGVAIKTIIQGSGQAINTAKKGNGDVLILHSKEAEMKFIESKYAKKRYEFMHNYFVFVGPKKDALNLSKLKNLKEVTEAIFYAIKRKSILFISRGDESGTHKKENFLWKKYKLNNKELDFRYYLESGSGMGATLNMANAKKAYTIVDIATWMKFSNKNNLKLLFKSSNTDLINVYSVIPIKNISAEKKILVNTFVKWILSNETQDIIDSYDVDNIDLFFSNKKI